MHLTAGLHRALQRHPEKIATVHGNRRQSHLQLTHRVARTASALRTLGLEPGERLAVLSSNSDRMMELLLAGWWCGLVMTPINTRWTSAELAFALGDCAASALAVDDDHLPTMLAIQGDLPKLRIRICLGESSMLPSHASLQSLVELAAPIEDLRCPSDALAAIVYTGGTTGFSKGVMLSHGNFWAALMGRMIEIPDSPVSTTLLATPMFHVAGLARMLAQIMVGGTSVITGAFIPQQVIDILKKEGVNDLMVVPSMLQMLLDTGELDSKNLPQLQRILWGAAPITLPLLESALQALPNVEFVHTYGMTETAASVATLKVQRHPAFLASDRIRSAGRAGLSSEIRIVDGQGRPVPAGTPGEIVVRGPSVMQGYWNRPDETSRALVAGWLHTGDGGLMDKNGYLFVIDRIKDMVISGGENVYPAEVESVLVSHPAVAMCAVIGVPHEKWGEAVHAIVVFKTDQSVSADELAAFCRSRLSKFKCPKSYEFREKLPLTPAGKVQKTELRKSHLR